MRTYSGLEDHQLKEVQRIHSDSAEFCGLKLFLIYSEKFI